MADVPRDPRQLARDILSGKIKIEDLARERQRQAGGVVPPVRGPQVPAKIPLPRPVQQPMARPPVVRQQPIPQRQPARQQVPARTGRQVPAPVPQRGRGPQMERGDVAVPAKAREALVVPAGQAQAYAQPAEIPPTVRQAVSGGRRMVLREMLKSRQGIRQGILLAEVLGKPVGLRE